MSKLENRIDKLASLLNARLKITPILRKIYSLFEKKDDVPYVNKYGRAIRGGTHSIFLSIYFLVMIFVVLGYVLSSFFEIKFWQSFYLYSDNFIIRVIVYFIVSFTSVGLLFLSIGIYEKEDSNKSYREEYLGKSKSILGTLIMFFVPFIAFAVNISVWGKILLIGITFFVSFYLVLSMQAEQHYNVKNSISIKNGYFEVALEDRVYEGNWVDGKKSSYGKMTYNSGIIYKGNWINDKYHGEGKLYFKNGDMYIGSFEYGLIHGNGFYDSLLGRSYSGIWKKRNFTT